MDMLQKAIRRVARRCMRGSPLEPCEQVQDLLKDYGVTAGHLLALYDVFYFLGKSEAEDTDEIVLDVTEIELESLKKLLTTRQEWVERLLDNLLILGGCEETVSWDEFLWIFIRFCSLSRVELSQCLFLIIVKETQSPTKHYLTAANLQMFYKTYKDCPVKSFRTQFFSFEQMPLSRYYVADFAELTQRFSQLINPIIHLQMELRKQLPSWEFWESSGSLQVFCRKVTDEFFKMQTVRVHLRGEPPFREASDNLVPDALGAVPINREQWIRRTMRKTHPKGLRQATVWGEQPSPEAMDLLTRKLEAAKNEEMERSKALNLARTLGAKDGTLMPGQEQGEEAKDDDRDENDDKEGGDKNRENKEGEEENPFLAKEKEKLAEKMPKRPEPTKQKALTADMLGPLVAWEGGVQLPPDGPLATPVLPLAVSGGPSALAISRGAPVPQPGPGPEPLPQPPAGPVINPSSLSYFAATMDEEGAEPSDLLPPPWMRGCTVAPAPVYRGSEPPPRTFGRQVEADDDLRRGGSPGTRGRGNPGRARVTFSEE